MFLRRLPKFVLLTCRIVGIIGSGQGMKADPKRSRHVHAKEG